jgi:hypothetical protein
MAFLGDPSTRTEEDTCFIATTFDLDKARLDWEGSAIVAWLLARPHLLARTAPTSKTSSGAFVLQS